MRAPTNDTPPAGEKSETNEEEADATPSGEVPGEETEEEMTVVEADKDAKKAVENEAATRTDESMDAQLEVAAKDPVAEETSVAQTAEQTGDAVQNDIHDAENSAAAAAARKEAMEANKKPERQAKIQGRATTRAVLENEEEALKEKRGIGVVKRWRG